MRRIPKSPIKKSKILAAIAHFITGILDADVMCDAVETLSRSSDFKPGDRVRTLRGTTRGIILCKLDDGRVVWRADSSAAELTSLPESLIPDPKSPEQESRPD